MFDYNQFNSTYEVDLAILSAVTSGGGGGGGVTPQQVSTMINSALTPYSTTSETEGMIQASAGTTTAEVEAMVQASAGTTTGQVQTQINSALTAYSTTSQVEGMIQASAGTTTGQVKTMIDSALTEYTTVEEVEDMIAASGGSGGKILVKIPWDNTAYTSTTIASLYADAEALYQSGLSVSDVFEKYDIALYDGIRQAMPCVFLKYVDGENKVQLAFINQENGMMVMYGNIYADGHSNIDGLSDINGSLNSKLNGMGVATVRALTQQEYDDEGYYDSTTLYVIKPSNN